MNTIIIFVIIILAIYLANEHSKAFIVYAILITIVSFALN